MKLSRILYIVIAITTLASFKTKGIDHKKSETNVAVNPVKLTWEMLRDVTFKKKWYPEESIYMLHPTFGPSVQKLKNQQVSITGYVLPVDLDANLYVLSAFPFSACFFCGGAGPETVMTLNFKKNSRKFKTDERLTFTGTLKLNSDDIYKMNYILEGAEITD